MQTSIGQDLPDTEGGQTTATSGATGGISCSRSALDTGTLASRPLWLTQMEADALLRLCMASPATCGSCEEDLFGKLGAHLQSFE